MSQNNCKQLIHQTFKNKFAKYIMFTILKLILLEVIKNNLFTYFIS